MSWKQRISVVALVVLAALPVSGVLCAMVCGSSAETSLSHHGQATQQCDEPAPSSAGVHIEGVSEHDCSAHAGLTQLGTAAAERIRSHVAPALSTPSARSTRVHFVPATGPVCESTKPPGSAPPTIPLILRV